VRTEAASKSTPRCASSGRAATPERVWCAIREMRLRKGRVAPDTGHHEADAVRTNNAQEMWPCRIERGLLQRATVLAEFAETRGDDDSGARPALCQLGDDRWHGLGRRDDDREVRGSGRLATVG
jgi:hypothetical protein